MIKTGALTIYGFIVVPMYFWDVSAKVELTEMTPCDLLKQKVIISLLQQEERVCLKKSRAKL